MHLVNQSRSECQGAPVTPNDCDPAALRYIDVTIEDGKDFGVPGHYRVQLSFTDHYYLNNKEQTLKAIAQAIERSPDVQLLRGQGCANE